MVMCFEIGYVVVVLILDWNDDLVIFDGIFDDVVGLKFFGVV